MSKSRRRSSEAIQTTVGGLTTKIIQMFEPISPKTNAQKTAFAGYKQGKNLLMYGVPGTGKTLISMNLALESVLLKEDQEKIIIVRSAVPTRDVGFLPGSLKDKSEVYERPYIDICKKLFPTAIVDVYKQLKNLQKIEFCTTSFVRGITFEDAVLILDEFQNFTEHELFSILTRIGNNCRIIISGDIRQNDLTKEISGFLTVVNVIKLLDNFVSVEFYVDDIIRSQFAKQFITLWLKVTDANKTKTVLDRVSSSSV